MFTSVTAWMYFNFNHILYSHLLCHLGGVSSGHKACGSSTPETHAQIFAKFLGQVYPNMTPPCLWCCHENTLKIFGVLKVCGCSIP